MSKINPPFNFYSQAVQIDTRLRCTQSQVYIEEKKPFFLVRFFRWITGQYNKDRIINVLNRIALDFIKNKHSNEECQALLENYKILILSQGAKSRTKLDPHNALINKIRELAEGADLIPYEAQPIEEVALEAVAIDPAKLKERWAQAVDGDDDWEQTPLVACNELPFSEKLATPKTILTWVINPRNQKLTNLPEIRIPENRTFTDLIQELLKTIGISTPAECIQLSLEPTEESLIRYLEKHLELHHSMFLNRGYLVLAE